MPDDSKNTWHELSDENCKCPECTGQDVQNAYRESVMNRKRFAGQPVSKSNEVTLTPLEVFIAEQVGVRRHVEAIRHGWKHRYGMNTKEGLAANLQGALGEMAAAKYLDVFWDLNLYGFKTVPDVGPYDVRTTDKEDGALIIRYDDPDDRIFILVTGTCPTYHIRGCMLAKAGKCDMWLKSPNGRPSAWFVPQTALSAIKINS
jgi:hypothetical protein